MYTEGMTSAQLTSAGGVFDAHVHTSFSDGDYTVEALLQTAVERGIQGVSITDHNGLWGNAAVAASAAKHGLTWVAGIEVTALYQGVDVHLLGYSYGFDEEVFTTGLTGTRAGYYERVLKMVSLCRQHGFSRVSMERIEAARRSQKHPSFISYDVAKQLTELYGMSGEEARRLTVKGGLCHVPYGDWALTPQAAIALIHRARGIAVLAHPGVIAHEASLAILQELVDHAVPRGLDGLEVWHPFHTSEMTAQVAQLALHYDLIPTGGSDWHGPGRFHDESFGRVGMRGRDIATFLQEIPD